jgi:tetratricopeptide (TPR) repeat protein
MPLVPVGLDGLLKLAGEFLQAGRLREAEQVLDEILAAVPHASAALHLKGIVLFRTNRHQAAAEFIERAVQLAPHARPLRRDLCPIYERLGRYEEALCVGQQALEVNPNDFQTLHNMALVYYRLLALDESIACARQALTLDPTAAEPHFQLAETLLLRGEFAEGLREYEWRYEIAGASPPLPTPNVPQWDGASLHRGRLLLIGDQGFGDVIQFCRYLPWAHERCPELVVAADKLLHPLIHQVIPDAQLVAHWKECQPFVAYCPFSGLPRLHGTTLENIPHDNPYLYAEPERTAIWRARLEQLLQPGLLRIGIVWAGRPTHNNDFNRSMGLSSFAPVAALNGIGLLSLQKGPAQSAIGGYFGGAPLLNFGAAIADFADTMAIIETLDLTITVDTSVAHLAAAMGKPVWILLPYAPDWRWLLDRTDSPWYPTARLFRQSRPGDWGEVMANVAETLARMLPDEVSQHHNGRLIPFASAKDYREKRSSKRASL